MKNFCTFIIVAYKPDSRRLRELLLHISPYHVVVIDNGDTSSSLVTNVNVVHPSSNLGYGGGANVGMEKAFVSGAQWVVVMNQDIQISQKAVNNFVANLEQMPPGIYGPLVGGLDDKRWTTILDKKKHKTTYVSGSFMAIHKDVIDAVRNFYAPYFMYYEEVDLCIRAARAGFPVKKLAVSISHEESQSLGAGSPAHEYYLARNHKLFVQRCAPWSVKLYELARLPKTISEYREKENAGALQGIKDYFFRRFGPYKEQA